MEVERGALDKSGPMRIGVLLKLKAFGKESGYARQYASKGYSEGPETTGVFRLKWVRRGVCCKRE